VGSGELERAQLRRVQVGGLIGGRSMTAERERIMKASCSERE
jgi:hypothetical protein